MCQGKSVYHGSSEKVLSYFIRRGYQCELHDNPADFVLDVLIDASQNKNNFDKLTQSYKQSSMHKRVMDNITQQLHRNSDDERLLSERKVVMKRSLGRELYHLSMRTLTNAVRNPTLFMSQTLVAIILGLLVGLVFYKMKNTTDPGIQNRLGAIFFMVVSQIFSTVTALESLLKERVLFIHVSPYESVKHSIEAKDFFLGEC
jgi:ATP-binding cassette subfamily G (WHITE) protein 2